MSVEVLSQVGLPGMPGMPEMGFGGAAQVLAASPGASSAASAYAPVPAPVPLEFNIFTIVCDVLKLDPVKGVLASVFFITGVLVLVSLLFKGVVPEWAQQQQGKLMWAFLGAAAFYIGIPLLFQVVGAIFTGVETGTCEL